MKSQLTTFSRVSSLSLLFVLGAYLLIGSAAISAQDRWIGGVSNWTNNAQWSLGYAPPPYSDVIIDSGSGDNVTLNTSPTINSLTLGGPTSPVSILQGNFGQSLTIESLLNVTGITASLRLNFNVVTIAGGVNNNGATVDLEQVSIFKTYGSVINTGLFTTGLTSGGSTIIDQGTWTNGSPTIAGGSITTNGVNDAVALVSLTNYGSLGLNGLNNHGILGSLDNKGTGVVDINNGSSLVVDQNVLNAGIITAGTRFGDSLSSVTIQGTLTNSLLFGLFSLGSTNSSGAVTNSGIMGLDGGSTYTINGDLNNSGIIAVGGSYPNNTLTIKGSFTNSASGSFVSAGTGDVTNIFGSVSNAGTMSFMPNTGSNTLNVPGTLTNLAGAVLNLGSVSGGSATAHIGTLINYGGIGMISGSVIDPISFTNRGALTLYGSTFVVGTGLPNNTGYYQFADGILQESITSTDFGIIDADGTASLDGTLDIQLQSGFDPAVGTTYKFLLFFPGQLNGGFATVLNDYFNNGTEMWLVTYDDAYGFVELTAEPAPSPEPSSLLLLGSGVLGLSGLLRKRLLPRS